MIRLTALSNSQVGPSDSSIQVVSAAGFPNSAPFTIRIDDELMSVVNSTVGGNGVGDVVGHDGTTTATTPASHNGNARSILIETITRSDSPRSSPRSFGSSHLGSSAHQRR